ncbi:MAG: class I SAM-dependent methyltransferase [Gammaproteobacteria bacterium]|nr:class I SAM-dependent methyltransferase [Gammaproteobacteria bacterium]
MKSLPQYTEANRLAWNEVMPKHQAGNQDKWDQRFSTPGYSVFESPEREELEALGIVGKEIAHLCCNNGVELMSLQNMGAARTVGFDISDEAIQEATQRAKTCGIDSTFIRTDVYEIDGEYDNTFELVYISIGCLGWMPDLKRFFTCASRLLKSGGTLFIYEQHPFTEMLSCDSDSHPDPLQLVGPYFKSEPYEENDGIDYIGKETYESKTMYWFVWTLSDILTALLGADFVLQSFQEYEKDISAGHQKNEQADLAIPLSYILIANKSE